MKKKLIHSLVVSLLAAFAFHATAQVVIPAGSLSHGIGEYNLTYDRTNTDISTLIGTTGSNYWDFSQPQAPTDVIGRVDIVPISDMGYGGNFPGATFAQRFNGGAIQGMSWEYYDVDPVNGLVLYGVYDPTADPSYPALPLTTPTSVLPASLYYGESWSITYDYYVYDDLFGEVDLTYQASAKVDAYGTLRLPGFDPVPALRLTLLEDTQEEGIEFQSDTSWQWLVPGIQYAAVQVVSFAPNALDISAQPYTNIVSRVFLSAPLAPAPTASLTLQSNIAALTWSATSNASGYVVETSTNLNNTNWLPVAQLTNQAISVPAISGASAQFFRITAQP